MCTVKCAAALLMAVDGLDHAAGKASVVFASLGLRNINPRCARVDVLLCLHHC